jgi:hypothetical protein
MITSVAASLDLSRATHREPLGPTAEGLSSATFERLRLDGESYVVKRLGRESDWVMRAARDVDVPYVARLFQAGVFELLEPVIDTALVDIAYHPDTGETELLMHDRSDAFLRDENPITEEQHAVLLHAMATMHAATWGWQDEWGLIAPGARYQILSPSFARSEMARGPLTGVPSALLPMWARLAELAPELHAILEPLAEDPTPLVRALADSPHCLVHGDWKGGNLGLLDDGRVLLVDWAFPGIDVPLSDLGWYLAVNCDRLPDSKEGTIEHYRSALESQGVSTEGWWDRQLTLALLGSAVQMAWNKCEQADELAWWGQHVIAGATLL